MGERMRTILGTTAVATGIGYIGTIYVLFPAIAANPAEQALLSSPWDLIVYLLIAIIFFDVLVQKTGNAMLTAMTFAISQILILDVFYVLNGNRAAYPAVLSAAVLLVSWYAIAKTYDALS